MAKRGPKGPSTSINISSFEKLCAIQCTQIEVAEFFNISVDTLNRHLKRHYNENFAEVFKKKSSKGKVSLRRKMWDTAMSGNVTMCIWLSKQMLGYADKVEQKSEVQTKEKRVVELKWADEDDLAAQAPAQDTASTTDQPIN